MKYKRVMLVIAFLALLVAIATFFQSYYTNSKEITIMNQSSQGENSPNINGVGGNVEISK